MSLLYFHLKQHIPAINGTHDLNILPVEGYSFSYCQRMQNIQKITNIGGYNKYTIKYIGKIDGQNYVIIYSNGHKNCKLITNSTFLHNTKLNEDNLRQKKCCNSHVSGRAISLAEMLHSMLKYSEVSTNISFICIPTTPLEFSQSIKLINIENNDNAHINTVFQKMVQKLETYGIIQERL